MGKHPFLREGRLSELEIVTGCEGCHGSGIASNPLQWETSAGLPQGIGRKNPDGSLGNCGACHGPHDFAVSRARRPEACGTCHVGPEHPETEIYRESKHGTIYRTFGRRWNWKAPSSHWIAGRDYRTPTCAACHISGTGNLTASHDVGLRLSWELQSSPTVRHDGEDWGAARIRMETVCRPCHAATWIRAHFDRLDRMVHEINAIYEAPLKRHMAGLYEKKTLDGALLSDESLEIAWLEMGRRESRSAKMGAAMMGPDMTWWRGLYALKKRFIAIQEGR